MEPRTTANRFSKRAWALAVLAAVAAVGLVIRRVNAQVGQGEANGLIGSWRVTVNVTDPAGVPSFPVLMTYHADGTLLRSRLSYIPAFAVLETTHYGVWKRINETQIGATAFSQSQGASGTAINGPFFGTEQVSFQPVISAHGNSFSAHWTSTGFDQAEIR